MEFDINKLVASIRDILDWILEKQCGHMVKQDLQNYYMLKHELSAVAYPESVLKLLVETKITNSYYRRLSDSNGKKFESDFSSFLRNQNFQTQQAIDELATLIRTYSIFPVGEQKAKEWVTKLLSYPTLNELSEELYRLRKKGKNGVLRDKGADHYLRNVGYWDIVPIDIHEKRFLVRTGIFHMFSVIGRQDPLEASSFQDALSRFCSLYLKGKIVDGIELSSAPGIMDLFIWSYCADERYKICASTPRCEECGLGDTCLFSIANIQKAIAQGRIRVSEELGLDVKEIEQALGQLYKPRSERTPRVKWEDIAKWIKADPYMSVQAMKQSNISRGKAYRYMERAGLTSHQIEEALEKVYIPESETKEN